VRNAVGAKKDVGVDNSGIIEANVAELKAHNGNVYALAIRNTGRVAATAVTKQGGRILLRANGGAIENAGELVARGTEGKGGDIQIHAGTTGSATISGKVDADGPTSDGGAVTITGGQVLVAPTAVITANGKTANLAAATGSNGWSLQNTGNATAVGLTGSAQGDTLTGGLGNDTLTGGGGVDRFLADAGTEYGVRFLVSGVSVAARRRNSGFEPGIGSRTAKSRATTRSTLPSTGVAI
jgi:Ca2+-binding RTX toxin-like protein